jgi:hypothetical protein
MSPVLCTKDESLDWTEITKSGTRLVLLHFTAERSKMWTCQGKSNQTFSSDGHFAV